MKDNMAELCTFGGLPENIGEQYGTVYKDEILKNLNSLVWSEGLKHQLGRDIDFTYWVKRQEEIIGKNWPWLLSEMKGVVKAAGVDYEDMLLLNLRAWQYVYYRDKLMLNACSSMAIRLADGTVACAGALDDPVEFYCGPVRFLPDKGYGFITFPITGTSWGNRGMNSRGLSIGISSQLLPGLKGLEGTINQDIAIRAILQTCANTDEVREFCNKYPFTMNLVCTDAQGKVFCAHQTSAGLLEIPSKDSAVLTNHVEDDGFARWLKEHGVTEFPENETTRFRRKYISDFIREHNGKCTMEEVLDFIGTRNESNPGSIHNNETCFLTFSNHQRNRNVIWIKESKSLINAVDFRMYSI